MSTRTIAHLIFYSSKHCRHHYPSKNFIALLSWFCDCHFDGYVSSNLRYGTCSHRTYVTQSRRLVEFSVSKWLKLTQFHLFASLFDLQKSNSAMWKPTRNTKNKALTHLPLAYHENSWTLMVSYRDYLQ